MRYFLIALLAFGAVELSAQYRYGLTPMTIDGYTTAIAKDSAKRLVDLEKIIPGIVLDIRYATTNNFTGEKIYNMAKAYARLPVAVALKKAQLEFNRNGYGIKVFDAYRPYRATVKFYEVYKDTTYVASPYRGSRHNRGCAIDMTLVDLKTGKELKMPTPYDSFQKEAWPSAKISDPEVLRNRTLLIQIMEKYGFKVNSSEWWHFDFRGWKNFEVMDIDFETLQKNKL